MKQMMVEMKGVVLKSISSPRLTPMRPREDNDSYFKQTLDEKFRASQEDFGMFETEEEWDLNDEV